MKAPGDAALPARARAGRETDRPSREGRPRHHAIPQRTGRLAGAPRDPPPSPTPRHAEPHLERCVELLKRGQLEDALGACDQALRARPDLAQAHLYRGSILQQQGLLENALAAYDQALRIRPDLPEAYLNRGVILQQRAQLEEALEAFDQALRIDPDYARAHFNRGVVLEQQGWPESAVAAYDQALRLKPDYVDACVNRGVALVRLGQLEPALEAFDQAVRLQPDMTEAHFNRGNALWGLRRFGEAVAAYEQATRIRPDYAPAHFNRAGVLQEQARYEQAVAAYDEALRFDPDNAAVHINRGNALRELGRTTEALAAYDQALRIQPGLAKVHGNRANVLADAGSFKDAVAGYREALRLQPDYADAHSNLLFCLNYDPSQDDRSLLSAHRHWGELHGHPANAYDSYANPRDPHKVLRVGLVSADFVRHPVGYLVEPAVAAADPAELQIVCYSGRRREDALTERLKAKATAWRSTLNVPDAALAAMIRDDGIDILIDLAGHTASNRLTMFALRPAPVQISWIGYPFTTGLAAIDYVLMDQATVPPGEERWFVEQVIRLPETRFCYMPPEYAPPPGPPPMLERGYVTYCSFNNLSKVTPDVARLWGRILKAVPGARLILKWKTLAETERRALYHQWFADHGVDPARVELRPATPHPEMLAEYGDVDIALDPFPYSGGITSLEALWQGVPVISLPGSRPVSRQTLGFLRNLGREEWVARDPEDYVRISVGLASDPRSLAEFRRIQRARMAASPLCDAPRFAEHFEAALRAVWRTWCSADPSLTH
jgi:protein O-GlcNAc transferase